MFPFTGLRLLLPAIVPSWRFFDGVSASPRLDYAVLNAPDDPAGLWQEFRPRPARLTLWTMLYRLLWNAQWNESLFLVSLAERLVSAAATPATCAHSERELLLRVARHLDRHSAGDPHTHLQIRLRFVSRVGPAEEMASRIVYHSDPWPIAELIAS